jgi:hypothetical protein
VGPVSDPLGETRALLARERPRRESALEHARPLAAGDPDVAALGEDLASPATEESLRQDPYWPKWASPWWKLLLLHELGLGSEIPPTALDALGRAMAERYLTFFPFLAEQIPPGTDPHRDIMCHCGLGCVTSLLQARGRDVEALVPWTRGWFLRYQLPDGGLNCDEQVYARPTPRSSIVSTVPVLEAVLERADRTPAEDALLARGARYLLARRLGCRSRSKGGPIEPRWLDPVFPRFYFYDVLRGLSFVTRWARAADEALPAAGVAEPLLALAGRVAGDGTLGNRRDDHSITGTVARGQDGVWARRAEASTFPLLERTRAAGPSAPLTRAWYDALDDLAALDAAGRLVGGPEAQAASPSPSRGGSADGSST